MYATAGPSGRAALGVGLCRLPAGLAGSNPTGVWISVVSAVWCQLEVSATDRSLVQRSPTDCGASLCVIQKHGE